MSRSLRNALLWTGLCCLAAGATGCVTFRRPQPGPEQASLSTPTSGEIPNPILVGCSQEEVVWERTVDVIHDYFDIERENRLDGVITTLPKVGASWMEPWHRDTVGWYNRWESTFQSIRRRAFIRITRGEGGFLVTVEVFKELEDIGVASNRPAGGATFRQPLPIQNDLNLIEGRSVPSGWISQGRDPLIEQRMLKALAKAYRKLEAAGNKERD